MYRWIIAWIVQSVNQSESMMRIGGHMIKSIRVKDQYIVVAQHLILLTVYIYILAINRLELAIIIWVPTYMKLVEPRRLFLRKTNKGRPKQSKGKALVFEWNFFKFLLIT